MIRIVSIFFSCDILQIRLIAARSDGCGQRRQDTWNMQRKRNETLHRAGRPVERQTKRTEWRTGTLNADSGRTWSAKVAKDDQVLVQLSKRDDAASATPCTIWRSERRNRERRERMREGVKGDQHLSHRQDHRCRPLKATFNSQDKQMNNNLRRRIKKIN